MFISSGKEGFSISSSTETDMEVVKSVVSDCKLKAALVSLPPSEEKSLRRVLRREMISAVQRGDLYMCKELLISLEKLEKEEEVDESV